MPRKGYISTKTHTFSEEIVEAIDKLMKDEKFVREMRLRGFTRISRELVVRVSVLNYLTKRGVLSTSGIQGK